MKKFIYFLFLFPLVFTSCEQDEIIDLTSNQEDKLIGTTLKIEIDPLMPTGDSTQDTENLLAAIHDSNLDDGGTLYLGSGTFLIHASLVRQALWPSRDGYNPVPFKGTIQGSGKDVTIIKSVRGPGGEDFVEFKDPDFEFTPATFFIGKGEYTGVRDLTFEADSEIIEEYYYGTWGGVDHFSTGLINYFLLSDHQGDSDIDNVYFKGSLNSDGLPEIAHIFQVVFSEGGTHTFKSCELENGKFDLLTYYYNSNSTINIGGKASEKVAITNLWDSAGSTGISLTSTDSNINISNVVTNNSGISSRFLRGNTLSNMSITKSDIKQIPNSDWAGIETWVSEGDVFSEISKNKIYSEDSFLWGPIFSEGIKNLVITNNKITGRGPAAIYLSVYNWSSGNATLVGNNLSTWENTGVNPWGFAAAPIWLGPYITDSFVVGGNNKVNIFDEPGYDDLWNPLPPDENGNAQTYDENGNIVPKNNIFTGVNNMHMNIGQNIREVMKQKDEAKKAMMNNKRRR